MKNIKNKLNLIILVSSISIFFALLISSAYFYNRYKKTELLLNNPTLAAKEEVTAVTAKIAILMELPKEEPVVVTVLDTTKLKGQQFFVNAKNGDKVVIYSKSNKAILYRPSTNRIIEVAPVQMGNAQAPIKIGVLNGTRTATGSTAMEKELAAKISNITVTHKGNAKGNYDKTIVIDVQGSRSEMAKQLAQFVGGEVSKLPTDETLTSDDKKNYDLLVIVGGI